MKWEDPIVKEVHEAREKIAAEHHYDIVEIGRYYQKKQSENDRNEVTLSPKYLQGFGPGSQVST